MTNRMRQPSCGRAHRAASFAVFALLSMCLPGAASAQWATNGNNINNTNAGNVGVGTSAPTEKLHVPARVRFGNLLVGESRTAGVEPTGETVESFGHLVLTSAASYDIKFGHAGAPPLMTLNSAGNVGIGTNTPQAKLDVAGGPAVVDNNQYFGFRRADNAVRRLIGAVDNGTGQHFVDIGQATGYITGIRFWPRDNITSPDVVISGSGYVGIGAAAPIGQLQVRRDHANTTFQNGPDLQLFVQNLDTSANNTVGLAFGGQRADGTSRLAGAVFAQMTSHASGSFTSDLVLSVTGPGEAPLEGLRVKSSGYVGIGTATPASRLHVGGQADNLFQVVSTGSAATDTVANFSSAAGNILVIRGNGKVGIGKDPAEALDVVGNIAATGNISAKYQDVAEWVPSAQKLAAGTVVVLDPQRPNHVLASTASYDTAVAGVISEKPGLALGEAGEGKLLVATTGRVKVRVDATRSPIHIGDLLVTSDVAGVAMRSEPVVLGGRRMHAPGTIIGKALEPLERGTGEILVLLSLQ